MFLLLAFTGMWAALSATLVTGLPLRLASALGAVVGLALPALALTAALHGRAGVRSLLRRCVAPPSPPLPLVTAVAAVPLITIVLALLISGPPELSAGVNVLAQFALDVVIALLTIQLAEELGWAGFAQDALQERHAPLRAAMLIAPAFAAIHLPTYLVGSPVTAASVTTACIQLLPVTVFAVAFRTLIAWSYNAAGASVLAAATMHASFNTASSGQFVDGVSTHAAAPLLPLLAVVLLAAFLAAATRGRLGHASPPPRRPRELGPASGVTDERAASDAHQ